MDINLHPVWKICNEFVYLKKKDLFINVKEEKEIFTNYDKSMA